MQSKNLVPEPVLQASLDGLENALKRGGDRALLILPMPLWQIAVAAHFVMNQKFQRVLVLSHQQDLLTHALEVFREVIGGELRMSLIGKNQEPAVGVLFATFQGMQSHLGTGGDGGTFLRDEFDAVICLETQRAYAKTFRKVVDYFQPKKIRFGLSDSPWRKDRQDVYELFGQPVCPPLTFEKAYVDNMTRRILRYFTYSDTLQETGKLLHEAVSLELEEIHREKVVPNREDKIRQIILDKIAAYHARLSIIYCQSIDHAERAASILPNAIAIHSLNKDREAWVEFLRESGEQAILTTVNVFNEELNGLDVDLIALWRFTEEPRITLRELIPWMNPYRHTNSLLVLDFVGSHTHLSKVRQIQARMLELERKKREGIVDFERKEPEIVNLPSEIFVFQELEYDITAPQLPDITVAAEKSSDRISGDLPLGVVEFYDFEGELQYSDRTSGSCRICHFATTPQMSFNDCSRLKQALKEFEAEGCLLYFVSIHQSNELNEVIAFLFLSGYPELRQAGYRTFLAILRNSNLIEDLEERNYATPQKIDDDLMDLQRSVGLLEDEERRALYGKLLDDCLDLWNIKVDFDSFVEEQGIALLRHQESPRFDLLSLDILGSKIIVARVKEAIFHLRIPNLNLSGDTLMLMTKSGLIEGYMRQIIEAIQQIGVRVLKTLLLEEDALLVRRAVLQARLDIPEGSADAIFGSEVELVKMDMDSGSATLLHWTGRWDLLYVLLNMPDAEAAGIKELVIRRLPLKDRPTLAPGELVFYGLPGETAALKKRLPQILESMKIKTSLRPFSKAHVAFALKRQIIEAMLKLQDPRLNSVKAKMRRELATGEP